MTNSVGGGPTTDADIRGEKRDDDLWAYIVKPALGCLADLKQAGDALVARVPDVDFGGLLLDNLSELIDEISSELEAREMAWREIDRARVEMSKAAGILPPESGI